MWAIVTGASSGIGRDMSRYLFDLGYNLVIIARDKDKLDKFKKQLLEKVEKKNEIREILVIQSDLSIKNN